MHLALSEGGARLQKEAAFQGVMVRLACLPPRNADPCLPAGQLSDPTAWLDHTRVRLPQGEGASPCPPHTHPQREAARVNESRSSKGLPLRDLIMEIACKKILSFSPGPTFRSDIIYPLLSTHYVAGALLRKSFIYLSFNCILAIIL